jgi:hypothetical protein
VNDVLRQAVLEHVFDGVTVGIDQSRRYFLIELRSPIGWDYALELHTYDYVQHWDLNKWMTTYYKP